MPGRGISRLAPPPAAGRTAAPGGLHGEGGRYLAPLDADEANAANAFRAAIIAACEGPHGKTRSVVARMLNTTPKNLENWMSPSSDRMPPMRVLFKLLGSRAILPDKVRLTLASRLIDRGGMVVMQLAETELDQVPAGQQMLEISAAVGKAAECLHTAIAARSCEGERVSKDEAMALLPRARDMLREAAELVHGLEALVGHTGTEPRSHGVKS